MLFFAQQMFRKCPTVEVASFWKSFIIQGILPPEVYGNFTVTCAWHPFVEGFTNKWRPNLGELPEEQ